MCVFHVVWKSCGNCAGFQTHGGDRVQAERELSTTTRGLDYWQQIKSCLAAKIPAQAYHNWVVHTKFEAQQDGSLRVLVPDQVTKDFLEQEYGDDIRRAILELNLPIQQVVYTEVAGPAVAPQEPSPQSYAEPVFASAGGQLNPKFCFENFVVGSCNQFAHAAARAVASFPARSYNPLFVYGGTGMGKTHLMHAIGRALLDEFPGMRVVYASGERFMNDMVSCLRSNRMPAFHRHYRSADVLLLDDVHILGGKTGTQEEFFHTFNELYEHQKQIVISSDSAPNQLPGLVERLRSRFEWGLIVDIQPPDLETKMAILDKKAESEGIFLPQDVRIFIATKTKSNVRELEGALTRLIAVSSVTGQPITMAMAQQTLKHLNAGGERKISVESILRAVAERFSMQPAQLKQKSNARQIAYPRQIAMYLVKELTHASLPEIGRYFGGKHHTTVLHSIQKIEDLRQKDEDLNNLIQSLMDTLQ